MEIKVICECGTKFKFDVEPVVGRMPSRINCPNCGADDTAQANDAIQQQLQAIAAPTSATTPPSGSAPGLRIARSAEPQPAPVSAASMPTPATPAYAPRRVVPQAKSDSPLKTWATLILCLAVVGFGAWKFGAKWYKRIKIVADVVTASDAADTAASEQQNFWFEDCVVLFVKNPSHAEVAGACADYWKDKLRRPLNVLTNELEEYGKGTFELWPEKNGYVQLFGGLDWPQAEYEGLSQYLSERFKTTVFEVRDVDFSSAYHFGVYELGARKFHAQMDIKMKKGEPDEVVTTEGNEWALANGYKPGAEGFKEFHLGDADKLAQKLGLKTWDDKPDEEKRPGLWLREPRKR
jgi:hypothetical protein